MVTLRETKRRILENEKHWSVALMDFVDDFRYYGNPEALVEPLNLTHEKWDALLASTAMSLCREKGLEAPDWVWEVPACREPWFPSGLESLKAIALVESPLEFRLRKIFVLENFLSRC